MAYPTEVAAAEASQTSSYRVKFDRERFLELVDIAKPRIIYHRGKNHFFGFDGFVMYSQTCKDEDFASSRVIDSLEFSNYAWAA
jgi:uncharacterized membrane protein YcgQ (UPF0703/DUF1980 family)